MCGVGLDPNSDRPDPYRLPEFARRVVIIPECAEEMQNTVSDDEGLDPFTMVFPPMTEEEKKQRTASGHWRESAPPPDEQEVSGKPYAEQALDLLCLYLLMLGGAGNEEIY